MVAAPVFVAVLVLAGEVFPAAAGGIEPGRALVAARWGLVAPFAPAAGAAAGRAVPGAPVAREVAETRTGVVPDGPC
ncbi:hypothetical protein ASG53_13815 [Sanguibacter sp. Leaf3]|nr:hypothetical protein ASG53_13815 [Sanguibacter sp. Leaf3]